MEATAYLPTTAATVELGNLPSDFKDFRGLPYWTDDLGTTWHLRAISHSREEVLRAYGIGVGDTGQPTILLVEEPAGSATWSLEVYPIPDGLAVTSDGEYPIQLPYWAYLPTPTTNDWFTDNAEEFLVYAATAEGFALLQDPGNYQFWRLKAFGAFWDQRRMAGGELKRAISRDKGMRLSSVYGIVPRVGARGVGIAVK